MTSEAITESEALVADIELNSDSTFENDVDQVKHNDFQSKTKL